MSNAHPSNAPDPFYVRNGCCITCGVPESVVPDLFGWTEDETHCFVRRQPVTPSEIDTMIEAMWSSEVDCIRYRGEDPALLTRIAEFGGAHGCDVDPGPILASIRTLVAFRSRLGREDSAAALADRFRASLEAMEGPLPMQVRPRWRRRPARVTFSWSAPIAGPGHFHSVSFASRREGGGHFEARLATGWSPAAQGLALLVHDWLAKTEAAEGVRWFSRAELEAGGNGFHMPI
jgi:hypothetical protein